MFHRLHTLSAASLIALVSAAALAGAPAATKKSIVAPLPPALARLLGPLPPLGQPALPRTKAYDETLLRRGREMADAFPGKPASDLNGDGKIDIGDYMFYDLPLVFYKIYYRTGDTYWRDKARIAAKAWCGYPGNQKIRTFNVQMDLNSTRVVEHAVKGMLPKGPLGRSVLKKLHVYSGADHPHAAQQPESISF